MDLRHLRARAMRLAGRGWATLGLLVVVAMHGAGLLPFQDALRTRSFDLYQSLVPREPQSAPAVIVDIDEESLARHGQWPWPRSLTATLVERIWALRPASVAIDVLMPEPDRFSACELATQVPGADRGLLDRVCALPSNDALLARALRAGPTVLGVAGIEVPGGRVPRAAPMRVVGEGEPLGLARRFEGVVANVPELGAAAAGHAILSADLDRGVVRRIPMVAEIAGTMLPSLALDALRLASGGGPFTVRADPARIVAVGVRDRLVPVQADGTLWVHYAPHDEARFVSAADVLDGTVDPERLRGRIVLVGVSALGLVDLQRTALGERVPGVEIHAQVLESIVDDTTLLRPAWAPWAEGALMLLAGLAIAWGFPTMRPRLLLPAMLLSMSLLGVMGLVAFTNARLLVDVVSPMTVMAAMFAAMLLDALLREELRRRDLESDLQAQRELAARVRGEMEAARRIQMGILPDLAAQFAHERRLEVAARMEPARQVGGDLYDCFALDDHRVCVLIGDVCGKGVASSLFMAISKTLCKSLALREGAALEDPGALMTRVNREVARDNPEMLFVTAFLAVLDLRTGELGWCNAGHDPPLVRRAGEPPRALDGRGGPALCILDDFEYEGAVARLEPGELLCLYTDGVTEAFDAGREVFGAARLAALLGGLPPGATAAACVDAIGAGVRAFEAGGEPSDDLTVVALRWTPRP